jgi:redox-sensing transcriptional repressor
MSRSKKKPADSPDDALPKAVGHRLSLYLRELQRLLSDGQETTSSGRLGQLLGISDAQVRKDLTYFGHFGYPGVGYRCDELIDAIRRILGTDHRWKVAMIGVGNLGRALLGYRGFAQQSFDLAAAFDVDQSLVGRPIDEVMVYHLDSLDETVRRLRIKLAMIAVPATAAQEVADRLVSTGIEGVVNFAPVTIQLPEGVSLIGVDLAIEMEQLTFAALNRLREDRSATDGD